MIVVFQRYLQIRTESRPTPNPVPNFEEHFNALCNLLMAYGEIADKHAKWSEDLIADWNSTLLGVEADEDDLEHPLLRILDDFRQWLRAGHVD